MADSKTTPCLDGDTLHLSPAQFALLQQTLASESARETHYEAMRRALRAIGLTDEQIESRHHHETKVVINDGR